MKYSFTAVALAAFSLTSEVSAAVLRSELKSVPNGWKKTSDAADDQVLSLSIGLKQQNEDQFYSKLDEISNPQHDTYGAWMEKEDVDNLLKPSADSKTAVVSWLKANGVSQIQTDDFYVRFSTDVATANKLLSAKYQNFGQAGINKVRTLSYSLPESVNNHIDTVSPTTYLGKPISSRVTFAPSLSQARLKKGSAAAANCSLGLTPQCIKDYYNVHYTPSAKSGSKIAFASFLNESAQLSDLALYEQANNLKPQNFSVITINGGINVQNATYDSIGEANLDAQNMMAVAQPLP